MIQKDYIMRMIEQLAHFLSRILLQKDAGNHKEALISIESALETTLGLDSKLLDAISAKDISELLGISSDPPTGSMKCIVAARLCKEKAEVLKHTETDDSVSLLYYQKALYLYLQGVLNIGYTELDMTGYHADIRQIADTLGKSISNDLLFKMFSLYKSLGKYDKAAECLFRLKNAGYPDIYAVGMEFFKGLAKSDEVELLKCNLTKEDIEEGLFVFNKRNSIQESK
jgi:hypothetical protein